MEFNTLRNQFYLTIDDVIQNTQFTSEDIYALNIDLNEISEATYRIMLNFYKGPNPQKHADILKQMIIDSDEKQNGLRNAMLEFLRGAVVSGMDLNAYIARELQAGFTRSHAPVTVKQELRIAGLYFPGEIL